MINFDDRIMLQIYQLIGLDQKKTAIFVLLKNNLCFRKI